MSNHDETPSTPLLPRWFFSAVGVVGSIVIMMAVLAIAYNASRPVQAVDADVVAERKKNLSDVQAKESDLYNNYSWGNQTAHIVRIPVKDAMGLLAAKLDAETKDKPAAPARLTLAASPAGFTPPAPPAPAAAPAASATAAPTPAPAAASAH